MSASFIRSTSTPQSLPFDMTPYSTRGEEFEAAAGSAFRTATTVGVLQQNIAESEVNRQQLETEQPDIYKAWEQKKRMRAAARPGFGPIAAINYPAVKMVPKVATREEMKEQMAVEGKNFADDIPWPKEGMTLATAKVRQEYNEKQKRDEEIMSRARPGMGRYAAQFGGAIAGGLADPVNLIPLGSGMQKAKLLGYNVKLFSQKGLQGLGKSAAVGFAENAAAAVAVDAIAFPSSNRWGAGLGGEDMVADAFIGGLIGAGLSTLGTAIGRRAPNPFKDKISLETKMRLEKYPQFGLFNSHQDLAPFHQDSIVKAWTDANAGRDINVAPIWEGSPIYQALDASAHIQTDAMLARQLELVQNMPPTTRALIEPKLLEAKARMGNVADYLWENRASLVNDEARALAESSMSKADFIDAIKATYSHLYFEQVLDDAGKFMDVYRVMAENATGTEALGTAYVARPSEFMPERVISLAEQSPDDFVANTLALRDETLERGAERTRIAGLPKEERISIDTADLNAKSAELDEIITSNRISDEDRLALETAKATRETAARERRARDEAIECIIQNGMG